jgi:hypothetical protein
VLDFQTTCISQRGKPQLKLGKTGFTAKAQVRQRVFISNSPSVPSVPFDKSQDRLSAVRYQEIYASRATLYG